MIKLQDFANQCGVTDRAIQKHLKKHEKELQGHFERKGPNGTWLDETAQAYIRSLMITRLPITDADTLNELQELKMKNSELQNKINDKDKLIAQKDFLNLELQKRLEDKDKELIEQKNKILQIEEKNEEKIKAAEDALKNELQEKHNQELAALQQQFEAEKHRKLSFKERLFGVKG